MKLILALAMAAFSMNAFSQVPAAVGRGISQPSLIRIPHYHNHPITPLLFEDFENPSGYDLAGWGEDVVGPGVVNEDYTATVLLGTQSLFIDMPGDDHAFTTNSFVANGHVWVAVILRITSSPIGTDSAIVGLYDASGNCQVKVTRNSDGDFKIHPLCSEAPGQTSFGPALNTTVYVWMEWNKDNGANSVATLAWSTTGVKPTSGDNYVTVTGTSTATDVSVIRLGSSLIADDIHFIVDHVLVDDVEIISYP